ncbi:hypothetical protein SAMN05216352_105112 [Alteribacillus bidgolensis]|uniref:Uncharacterized protein n=1 Tax=Alteribacillus bidgolensis TaxID=930129 RepID=A0A1G8IAN5_9BACI|nr:hypothetical protein SAMN05216352_105112 [Alteribacillus bidgolensis]
MYCRTFFFILSVRQFTCIYALSSPLSLAGKPIFSMVSSRALFMIYLSIDYELKGDLKNHNHYLSEHQDCLVQTQIRRNG